MDQNPNSQNAKKPTEPTVDARHDAQNTSSPETTQAHTPLEMSHASTQEGQAVNPAPTSENHQFTEPATTLPPKKKHTGVIILIVIIALLILTGGGFLIWYFAYYNNPERVVFEAAENLFGAEHLAISDGRVLAKIDLDNGQRIVAQITFDTAAMNLPSATNAKLELSFYESQDPDASLTQTVRIDLGTVQLTDGMLYLKVGNLVDSIDATLKEQNLTLDDLGPSAQLIYDLVAEVDNEWWQISYRDLLEMSGASRSQVKAYEDFYSCLVGVVNQDHSAEFKQLYQRYSFLTVERKGALVSPIDESYGYITAPAGYSLYEVGLDFDQLAGFANALPESRAADQIYGCYNQYIRDTYNGTYADENGPMNAEMFSKVSADDLRRIIPEDYYIRLEISNFGHEVKSVLISNRSLDNVLVSLVFNYQATEVTAPSDYRPITDLLEEIGELVQEVLMVDFSDDIMDDITYNEEAIWES